MTANLLTLKPSKTELLIINVTKQLAKTHNSSLNTTDSPSHLSFISDEHLTFCTTDLGCYYHIRQLCHDNHGMIALKGDMK